MGEKLIYSIRFKEKGEKFMSRWAIVEAESMVDALKKFHDYHYHRSMVEKLESVELTNFNEIIT